MMDTRREGREEEREKGKRKEGTGWERGGEGQRERGEGRENKREEGTGGERRGEEEGLGWSPIHLE